MTQPWGQTPTPPQPPPWDQASPSRPVPKRSKAASTVTIVVASLVGLLLLAADLLTLRDLDLNPGAGVSFSVGIRGTRIREQPAATAPASNYPAPKLSDFKLAVKELRRQKFGPAGANVTYYIVASRGPAYDPDKTYALVYEVGGGEDGPVRNYIEIRGDQYKSENSQFIATSQVDQRLTVKALSVEEVSGASFTPRSCQPH
jgi:hypothetical protein